MLNTLLKKVNDTLVFQGDKLEIFVPAVYFEQATTASFEGAKVKTFGLLYCRGYNSSGKVLFTEILNLPTMITLTPDSTYNSTVSFDGRTETKYVVCVFTKNSPVTSAYITVDPSNVEKFLDMMLLGKISGVPYGSLLSIWNKNMSLSGLDLGVPSSILEIIISEMYRSESDPTVKYCISKSADPKLSETAYDTTTVRELCARNSVFAALSFEDMDSMITVSLNTNRENRKQKISPIEKVIKY